MQLKDAFEVYQTTYKTPMVISHFQLEFKKSCHLLVELEHKAYQVIKFFNFDNEKAREKRPLQLNEFEEFHLDAYENARIYKERIER